MGERLDQVQCISMKKEPSQGFSNEMVITKTTRKLGNQTLSLSVFSQLAKLATIVLHKTV